MNPAKHRFGVRKTNELAHSFFGRRELEFGTPQIMRSDRSGVLGGSEPFQIPAAEQKERTKKKGRQKEMKEKRFGRPVEKSVVVKRLKLGLRSVPAISLLFRAPHKQKTGK